MASTSRLAAGAALCGGAAFFAAAFAPLPALAQIVDANSVRLGMYDVFYHVKASDINGPFVPAGVNLDTKNLVTPYLAYTRELTSFLQLEIAAGWPPNSKTIGKGPATLGSVPYNGQEIATAKWFAPTVLLNYEFLPPGSVLRPYVGLGVNYTHFYDRKSTAAGDAANGGPTSISLSDSLGPAATVGLSWRFLPDWSLNGSYSWSKVTSNLSADTSGAIRTSHINFNPQALVVSVGWWF